MKYQTLLVLAKYAKQYGHEKIKPLGISDTEHAICSFLCFHSEVSQDTIANALMLDKTTVAKALNKLENGGFVERLQDASNKRKNSLVLTQNGREKIADAIDIYDRWITKISACLTVDEQKAFENYCTRIAESAMNYAQEENNDK